MLITQMKRASPHCSVQLSAGHTAVVECLLSAGAESNEKSNQGLTPLHAACYSGHLKVLIKLLEAGGDLRLHDYQGRSVKDWAMLNPNPKKRMKILEFLDKTRLFAMSGSGHDLLLRKASSKTLSRAHQRRNTVTRIIRDKIGMPSIHDNLQRMANSHHSLGFGQVYAHRSDSTGFVSAIPFINENSLRHDNNGELYSGGTFSVMESMWWDYTQVTVKRLHKDIDPYSGGVVDLLINEIEHIGKLRHPYVLTLMGVCQTTNLDGMILVYERVGQGSLYNYLHHKMERLPSQMIQDIALQMCNAIIFIHLRGLVHCAITSHAISVVNMHTYKLGNFEYMIEASKCEWGKKNAVASNHEENAVYNWMAPEVMMHMPPSFYCDMFSYAAIVWEMFHNEVPWNEQCADSIKASYCKGNRLSILNGKMPEYFKIILEYGLQHDPTGRKLSFLHVRDILTTMPKDAYGYIKSHLKSRPPADTSRNQVATAPQSQNTNNSKKSYQKVRDQCAKESGVTTETEQDRSLARVQEDVKRAKEKKKDSTEELEEDTRVTREDCRVTREDTLVTRSTKYGNKKSAGTSKENRNNRQQLHFNAEGLRWDAVSQQDDEDYTYSVQLKISPQKSQTPQSVRKIDLMRREEEQHSMKRETPSDSCTDSVKSLESADNTQYAKGRELGKVTSSMGKFSFLQLGNHQRTRSAGAKPACHQQTDIVAEEYSTSGKLTIAGSLYALYNDHSPNRPLGQLEHQRENSHYATMPSRKKQSPVVETDPSWFGGRGSVRNLAKAFQEQIQHHAFYQAVVDGTVNKEHSQEHPSHSADFNCHSATKPSGVKNAYKLTYDTDEDSGSTFTCSSVPDRVGSENAIDSSTESDIVSKWVDHEITKIKRNLTREVVPATTARLNTVQSPELFDDSENTTSPPNFPRVFRYQACQEETDELCNELVTPDTSETSLSSSDKHNSGDHVRSRSPVETFYFDDELYSNRKSPKITRVTTENQNDTQPFIPSARLPMTSILKRTKSSSDDMYQESSPPRVNPNKKRTNKTRIPTSSRSNPHPDPKANEGAFANIVTVRSNLDDEGVHQVTHRVKNLRNGASRTLLNNTVNAQKVITKFTSQK
ncbi:inactive serine/threonine-protein kinase TEX14-like isoform X2 [Dreissena polymorpha]|uniref:inactive serine/threonine-protein kinase TEX14-like isoform X2 n=1 Tax=Dreissena polymorpha TaxID=45954 RepID=UPI0022644BCB|nr:inactive serine/threonine-protein kinase TEX14-like isoform X2 [Dreissena polymorpha]